MERILGTGDLVTALEETLSGRRTKKALGDWAHEALLRADRNTVPYDYRHRREIHETLVQLLYMAEGPEYELDDDELHSLIASLERLN